jgi:2-dehydropantoate 2-reductase
MKIAILGAGGVGGYYGGLLARGGHEVVMLARGAHLDALRSRGMEVRTPEDTFTAPVIATDDPKAMGAADYAIVAVKNYSLVAIMPAVRIIAERGAILVPLLNGVEVVDRLVEHGVPRDRLLGGLTAISARRVAPGLVERMSPFQRLIVGEIDGSGSARAQWIAETFRAVGVDCAASREIQTEIWRKFAFIASMAAACGLARSPIGPLRATPLGRRLIERAVHEVITVAHSRGVALRPDEEAHILGLFETVPSEMKPSLLLDLESGGPTEIDDMSGAVSRLGAQAGLATPVHDTAAAALGVAQQSSASSLAPNL